MNLQGRNLSLNLQGEDVKLLQTELHQLGFLIANTEFHTSTFGFTTHNAVIQFQQSHNLPATGIVDAAVAHVLNTALDARRVQTFTPPVNVIINHPGGVLNLPSTLPSSTPFLSTVPPGVSPRPGTIPLPDTGLPTPGTPQPGTQPTPSPTPGASSSQPGTTHPDQTVLIAGSTSPSSSDNGYLVQGHITQADGRPLPGVIVRAFDKDVRREERLGIPAPNRQLDVFTDPDGFYKISYTPNQFARAEKNTADLIVRGFTRLQNATTNAEQLLVESPILFNAPKVATVDLVVALTAPGILSEYEKLLQDIEPLLVNVTISGLPKPTLIQKLADLKPDELNFLTQEMAVDRQWLEFLSTAAQLQTISPSIIDLSIPAAIFYGLARKGLPLDLNALALQTDQARRNALEQAIQENIIPASLRDNLDAELTHLQNLLLRRALRTPLTTNQPPLTQILANTLPSDQQTTLLKTYVEHIGPIPEFWNNLRQLPDFQEPGKVEKLQFTLQLNTLTQSNLPLVNALQGQFQSTRAMAKADSAELARIIQQSAESIPPDFPGDTREEKVQLYTRSVTGLLQGAFPTETIAQVIARVSSAQFSNVTPSQVTTFLNRATDATVVPPGEEFDIVSTHIDSFIRLHGDKVFAGMEGVDAPSIVREVKRSQRLFQVSTSPETFQALLESGLHSASEIAQMSPRSLQDYFGDKVSLPEQQLIHQRAMAASASALSLGFQVYQAANDAQPAVIGSGIKQLPDWASLFGSLEMCDCKDCRSVYSPAAYFVDLLQFLDSPKHDPKNLAQQTANLLDMLIGNPDVLHPITRTKGVTGKRPDLPHIELSCENTNTPLPYIDLVNEVLESYVARGVLDQSTAKDTGDSTPEELSANPQYVEVNAYKKLRDAVFPITLPFDRDLEIARLYLNHLSSSRNELMQDFGVEVNRQTSEALGLAEKEFEILTGVNFQGLTTLQLANLYVYPDEILTPSLQYSPNFRLDQIMSGSAVLILQAKLNTDGANPKLTLSGLYDAVTSEAVKAFQQRHNLPVSGDVGAPEWAVLATIKPDAVGAILIGVPEFLQRTELSYVDLIELLKTRFINPNQRSLLVRLSRT